MKARLTALLVSLALLTTNTGHAQQLFSSLVGPTPVKPVAKQSTLEIPYITWGGDAATFLANGGLQTQPASFYGKQGLKIKLTPGDDFVGQVKNYMSGKTPFLRGTFRMLGQASEVIGSDPRTKPVVILQLSWSGGDHIVSRAGLKSLDDLKGDGKKKVRIACQQGGPHLGLLYDAMYQAKIKKEDVDVVFVKDLTGENGAAEAFRKDATIDACCVITPDMIGLTGGLDSTGSGAEGTVKGAKVLVSTQQMTRSIADVYAVRSDWYQANRETVEKFVAGYLSASEQVVKLRADFEKTKRLSPPYRSLLSMSQQIFGEEVLPTLEVDAHGLLLDCSFVGLPGQIAFFKQSGNLNGFSRKLGSALDLAVGWGYARTRSGFEPVNFDYKKLADLAGVPYVEPKQGVTGELSGTGFESPETLEAADSIVSFTINFKANDPRFSVDQYGSEFRRALEAASTFGGATLVIRGHADPTKTLVTLIRGGLAKGIIRRTGQKGKYRYFVKTKAGSKPLNLEQTDEIVELIKSGAFEGAKESPQATMQAALNLSLARAAAVKTAISNLAKSENINLNLSQLQPVGVGISEPLVSKPTNAAEAAENMRVEFRIVKVDPETVKSSDFDF